jgi:hypothetical protein
MGDSALYIPALSPARINGMSDALSYRLNECWFKVPHPDVQDASINILKFAELGTSLIVTRSLLNKGETLRSNLEEQLKRLEQQVQELRCQPVQDTCLGAARGVEALEVHSQFIRGADKVFQFQLIILLSDSRQMLALSYVKPEPLGELDAAHWTAIKASLQFEAIQ